METNDNVKESGDSTEEYVSLTHSPYVGGNKMSSSLKDRLKRSRMSSSPLSKPVNSTFTVPVASGSVKLFESSTDVRIEEYSREDIEKAMNVSEIKENDLNEPDQVIIEKTFSLGNANYSIDNHHRKMPDLQMNENAIDEQNMEIVIENIQNEPDPKININTIFEPYIEIHENAITESYTKINENAVIASDTKINENATNVPEPSEFDYSHSYSKYINDTVETLSKINENVYSYSKEDIDNCADKDKLLEIYSNLQKETSKNEEILRKLKLVQKHHTKNNPDALIDLTQKWLTCTQLSLRMLYEFMPEPRSITFEDFLIFLQVDFDIVKYNPESDTFS